ncbi:MAG: sigma-54 dependent transcriptional regulator [Bacteroides sp.]|nr:sigma-54 dependent transcriptional regulator [Bacteroides sp.]
MKSILIVEDDITFGMMLKTWLKKKGFTVSSASTVARAKKHLETEPADLVLSDLRLPDKDGIYLLSWLQQQGKVPPFIMMTGYADIPSAVQAIKMGAQDYIAKPVNPEELLKKIHKAFEAGKDTPAAPAPTKEKSPQAPDAHFLEGESGAARQLYNYVNLVAPTNMSVLINGASGTGKEYVAHRIHQLSKRAGRPFIAVDCGSIPKELAASEFFGHVKGAFTGALQDKTGAFVAADGGTLFLDEVGNLGYETQIQLLRALQERKIRPIGSTQETQVDIRLITATNENLELLIEKGSFREDLYHRLNEFTIHMPALKDRQEDILLFANFFLDQANRELDKKLIGFDEASSQALYHYHWPGNLRQMKNTIKRATLLATGNLITLAELGHEISSDPGNHREISLRNEKTEREYILEALRQTGNNKSKAAALLKIDRKTLYNKMKLYRIEV